MPIYMSANGWSTARHGFLQMALLFFVGVDKVNILFAVHLSQMVPKSGSPGFGDVDEEQFLQDLKWLSFTR